MKMFKITYKIVMAFFLVVFLLILILTVITATNAGTSQFKKTCSSDWVVVKEKVVYKPVNIFMALAQHKAMTKMYKTTEVETKVLTKIKYVYKKRRK